MVNFGYFNRSGVLPKDQTYLSSAQSRTYSMKPAIALGPIVKRYKQMSKIVTSKGHMFGIELLRIIFRDTIIWPCFEL